MALRGCSSVIKARQDAAIAAGVAPLLTELVGGVHATDRETMLRTAQCLLGICDKNPEACAAFKEAGAAVSAPPTRPAPCAQPSANASHLRGPGREPRPDL